MLPKVFYLVSCLFALFSSVTCLLKAVDTLTYGKGILWCLGEGNGLTLGDLGFVPVSATDLERLWADALTLLYTCVPIDEIKIFLQISEDYSDYLRSAFKLLNKKLLLTGKCVMEKSF